MLLRLINEEELIRMKYLKQSKKYNWVEHLKIQSNQMNKNKEALNILFTIKLKPNFSRISPIKSRKSHSYR